MRRLVLLGTVLSILGMAAPAAEKARPAITVTGEKGPNRWDIPGDSTANKPATIGDPAQRMQVPVANGDVVAFVTNSGSHHVIFENAKSEQAAGVWQVVPGSGSLKELEEKGFPHYKHGDAYYSEAGKGDLIQIRIVKLEPGKGILFACYDHSESDTGTKVPMLGLIVPK